MSWGRIDDGFDDHPKVLAILDEDEPMEAGLAIGLWTLCLTWAHRNTRKRGKVPGLLPAGLPRRFFGVAGKIGAALLVKHGLWDMAEQGGWMIHDFDDYLPTEETKAARAAAGRRGAAKRWGRKREDPDAEDNQTNITDDGKEPSPDSKLPSGDGNEPPVSHGAATGPIANDGSRAPARRAISKEIAPIPEPIPIPEVLPPSAGAEEPPDTRTPEPPVGETEGQRVNRLTRTYTDVVKMSKFPAVMMVVQRAARSGYSDADIERGLKTLAAEKRSVTVDTLRIAMEGPARRNGTPPRPAPEQPPARCEDSFFAGPWINLADGGRVQHGDPFNRTPAKDQP